MFIVENLIKKKKKKNQECKEENPKYPQLHLVLVLAFWEALTAQYYCIAEGNFSMISWLHWPHGILGVKGSPGLGRLGGSVS